MGSLALPSEWSELKRQTEALTTQQLRSELVLRLGLTAGNLLRLAVIVNVLEDRGDDLSSFNGGLMDILRGIACGKLLPELVVMYASEPEKIRRASRLTLREQQEIFNGKKPFPEKPRPVTYKRSPPSQARAHGVPPNIVQSMAANGLPRDVGETAAEMVMACKDPKAALEFLLWKLQRNGLVKATPDGKECPPELAGVPW